MTMKLFPEDVVMHVFVKHNSFELGFFQILSFLNIILPKPNYIVWKLKICSIKFKSKQ